jgi:hypothetical protein
VLTCLSIFINSQKSVKCVRGRLGKRWEASGETHHGAYPIHTLQIVSKGILCADSLQLEDITAFCVSEVAGTLWSLPRRSGYTAAVPACSPTPIMLQPE